MSAAAAAQVRLAVRRLQDERQDVWSVVAHGHGEVRRGGRAAAEARPRRGQRLVREAAEQVLRVRAVVVHDGVEQRLGRAVAPLRRVLLPVEGLHGPHVLQHPHGLQVPHRLVEEERDQRVLLALGVHRGSGGEKQTGFGGAHPDPLLCSESVLRMRRHITVVQLLLLSSLCLLKSVLWKGIHPQASTKYGFDDSLKQGPFHVHFIIILLLRKVLYS